MHYTEKKKDRVVYKKIMINSSRSRQEYYDTSIQNSGFCFKLLFLVEQLIRLIKLHETFQLFEYKVEASWLKDSSSTQRRSSNVVTIGSRKFRCYINESEKTYAWLSNCPFVDSFICTCISNMVYQCNFWKRVKIFIRYTRQQRVTKDSTCSKQMLNLSFSPHKVDAALKWTGTAI